MNNTTKATERSVKDAQFARAMEAATAAETYRAAPTRENAVLHAIAVWRKGCTHGGPGECEECNDLFLKVLSERLCLGERYVNGLRIDPPKADDDHPF